MLPFRGQGGLYLRFSQVFIALFIGPLRAIPGPDGGLRGVQVDEIFLDEFGLFGGELGVVHDDTLPRWGPLEAVTFSKEHSIFRQPRRGGQRWERSSGVRSPSRVCWRRV